MMMNDVVSLRVKFCGKYIPIAINLNMKVMDLKTKIYVATAVYPTYQKLIYSGVVLDDDNSLGSFNLNNRSVMMMVGTPNMGSMNIQSSEVEIWEESGYIDLQKRGLMTMPYEIWAVRSSTKVLNLSDNLIDEVPATIKRLTSLKTLDLNDNLLSYEHVDWESLCGLDSLTVLNLSQNSLSRLPSAMGLMKSLCYLDVGHNKLTCLPDELAQMKKLQELKANNNRIVAVPSCICGLSSLTKANFASNLLVDLPETFSQIHNIEELNLSNNHGLKCLPATLLKQCTSLSILDLHGTEITVDLLGQYEGWESFDERRRGLHVQAEEK